MKNIDEAYEAVLDELNNGYSAFHKVGAAAYDPGLTTTRVLAERLGNPQEKYKTIHVGGTNGKGSTAHTLAAVLGEAGFKVGLYTSPHILDFRERIRIDGRMVEKEDVVQFMNRFRSVVGDFHPSFFEVVTLMAFDCFAKAGVDIAIIEVGLGGRLDSTNIITPVLSVITNISLDHISLLGDTEEAIAAEKAGIIKLGVPVVIGKAEGGVFDVFRKKAEEMHAPLTLASEAKAFSEATHSGEYIEYTGTRWGNIKGELTGDCQIENTATILTALSTLEPVLGTIPAEAVARGFAEVTSLTGLSGRWMVVSREPVRVICDTGHNIGGWKLLGPALKDIAANGQLHMVLGFVNDKDVDHIMAEMPAEACYYFATPSVDRGRQAASTAEAAAAHGINGLAFDTVAEAYGRALADAQEGDTIFVGGSTFIVADFLASQNN